MEMEYFKELIQTQVKDKKTIVELGTGKAESSYIILEAMEKRAVLYSYDINSKLRHGNGKNWIYYNENAIIGFEKWNKGQVDMLFVDTDPHSFEQTYLWCLTWFGLLSEDGISLWHDTELIRAGVDVKGALKLFAQKHKAKLEFVEEDYGMGIMRKEKNVKSLNHNSNN